MSFLTNGTAAGERAVILPTAPENLTCAVKAWREAVKILTYEAKSPDLNPMFLENRVYQGSSGRIYPLPFIDRIATEPCERLWDAIHIENEYIRLMILPEIGGRIHIGFDKISGYDFFYRQNVIKPALVGLAGPWASGGVEFNWPQHHRPATFMPMQTEIEYADDGSVTVWCSDHDPMLHMKGMHGICLKPGRAIVELKARLYNRTPFTQTFLWWANAATRAHEQYQSFFPPDVRYVADHAKRAITSFPLSDRPYYGVDYPERARTGVPEEEAPAKFQPDGSYAANDLSWYANIPVPTSYMVTGTSQDFFGGYDHRAQAGVVHVANHHIAPGKKQWTWGNHEFGYAWDASLTDTDGPYIELMAGVYTDNQPDFAYLAPWETKTFTQNWYPIRATGIPQAANEAAALHLRVDDHAAEIAVGVTRNIPDCSIQLLASGVVLHEWNQPLLVAETFHQRAILSESLKASEISVVLRCSGSVLLSFDPASVIPVKAPDVAQEPLAPEQIVAQEDLFLTGLHLDQYRHATRHPEPYWREAIRRDPGDSRSLNALGLWHLRRGEFTRAVDHFRLAVKRLTRLNANPYDGEPYYNLGLALRFLGEDAKAYDAFYKATWNAAWRSPAYFALAEIDTSRQDWHEASDHLCRTLLAEGDHLNARTLLAFVYRHLENHAGAAALISETSRLDPLDGGVRWLQGRLPGSGQELLDLAFDLLRAGLKTEARHVLGGADPQSRDGSAPIILLLLADLQADDADRYAYLQKAQTVSRDYCLPHRLDELLLLERTLARNPENPLASYFLGNLLYDRQRYEQAIGAWERAAAGEPQFSTVWRNLGIAYFNVLNQPEAAIEAFQRAFAANPTDARVFYERDQLWKRTGRAPNERLAELLGHPQLVELRDDLSIEIATLQNQLDRPAEALKGLQNRHFQPWEGGEGLVLGQYVRARLLLGRDCLVKHRAAEALEHFLQALRPPSNLSEAKHLLANQSDVCYWVARAYEALEQAAKAREWYLRAARQKGDFQQMAVRNISSMTYWSALALERLGQVSEAKVTFHRILTYSDQLGLSTPKIDYFATSLPTMLLFNEDLGARNRIEACFLRAQAMTGLGEQDQALTLLHKVLHDDANHIAAQDLLLQLQGGRQELFPH